VFNNIFHFFLSVYFKSNLTTHSAPNILNNFQYLFIIKIFLIKKNLSPKVRLDFSISNACFGSGIVRVSPFFVPIKIAEMSNAIRKLLNIYGPSS